MKRFLLPHAFQTAGWLLLLASLVTLVVAMMLDLPAGVPTDGTVSVASADTIHILTRAILIGAQLSIFLIACSRERIEDEMVSAMRQRALASVACILFAIYTVIAVVSIITGGDMAKDLATSVASPTTIFWAYEIVFRINIARNRKRTSL